MRLEFKFRMNVRHVHTILPIVFVSFLLIVASKSSELKNFS